ncbi:MAG: carboxypeptidase-like regulatory domain-containing protein [Pirellulales bacterium]
MHRLRFTWLAVVFSAGCSSAPPELPPLSGTVTYQGAPVQGAIVVLHPAEAGELQPAQATTDSNGQFAISTHIGQGAYQPGLAPGKYLVEISKREVASDFTRPPRHLLPEKYASAKTSELTADVPAEGVEELEFTLE